MKTWIVSTTIGLIAITSSAWAEVDRINLNDFNILDPVITTTLNQSKTKLKIKQPLLFTAHETDNSHLVGWQEGRDVQYAIFRSPGDIYVKGRAGYLTDETRESFDDISIEEIINTFDDNGALGIGAGYTLKNGNKLEFDYTVTKRAEQIIQVEYLF